ncbi:uncharacterized protein K452DRAFT_338108 [Aplosporella prunicola CBS 121167]|uniref:Uncharacterized protein n=1 Tax=Aplosporella prunicola CBS 121167 TaxID=1176127 RepID=A0A6A6B6P3_9PEZI|nr:uncharacterized protein K452DRAFT_338108 [Aplosporella prunicola CBS 121167]KAF2138657.1 hypothetical protein K452DRAFT_338108 [Aplosporella prunicola CBS 121167]
MSSSMQLVRYIAPAVVNTPIRALIVPQTALRYIAAGYHINVTTPAERNIVTASSLFGIITPGHDNHAVANGMATALSASLRSAIHRYGDLPSAGFTLKKQHDMTETETAQAITTKPIMTETNITDTDTRDSGATAYDLDTATESETPHSADNMTQTTTKEPAMFNFGATNAVEVPKFTITSIQSNLDRPRATELKAPHMTDVSISLPIRSKKPRTTSSTFNNATESTFHTVVSAPPTVNTRIPESDILYSTSAFAHDVETPVMLTKEEHNRKLAQPRSRKTSGTKTETFHHTYPDTEELPIMLTKEKHNRKLVQPRTRIVSNTKAETIEHAGYTFTIQKNIDTGFGADLTKTHIFEANFASSNTSNSSGGYQFGEVNNVSDDEKQQQPFGSYALTPQTLKLEPERVDVAALARLHTPSSIKEQHDTTNTTNGNNNHHNNQANHNGHNTTNEHALPTPQQQQQNKGGKRTGKKKTTKSKAGKHKNGKSKK